MTAPTPSASSDDRAASSDDIDPTPDPAAMYALLNNQQRNVANQMGSFVPVITASWGATYILGFTALWLIDGLDGFSLPVPVAVGIFIALLAISAAVSTVLGIRSGRGIRSTRAAAFTGIVDGLSWPVAGMSIGIFGAGLRANGLTADLANIFYPTAFVLLVGFMYVVAAAIWRAVPSLVCGIGLMVVAVIAPFIGYPHHYLFFALAGGGVFVVLAVYATVDSRRVRRTTELEDSNRG